MGEKVLVRLRNLVNGRRRLAGILREVTADGLAIEVEGEHFQVAFSDVERSRLAVDWTTNDRPSAESRQGYVDKGK